ncbi:MAG TPA: GGDEF domain-containing protein [Gemmatimonadales bacterium]|nr:GGDEF domain-containing protein [Gemmatimonadales bacterium]
MDLALADSLLGALSSAFAAACRLSRSNGELLEHCRTALVHRFGSDRIWITVLGRNGVLASVGKAPGREQAVEVARLASGDVQVVVAAEAAAAGAMRGVAMPLAFGLAVLLEMRGVLLDRDAALEAAGFQLRALRQVTRLLSSVHSTEDTEHLVLDFMAEVFFAWWACLYRPAGRHYVPRVHRSLARALEPQPIDRLALDRALPLGSNPRPPDDAALAALLPPGAKLVATLDAGVERMAVLALGPAIHERQFGPAEFELAATLAAAAAIALKNAELVEQLHSAATTDALTGVYNRRALEERLAAEIARGVRHQFATSVVLVDVDRFKLVNDTLGHAAGDRLLTLIADLLRRECRSLDVVGRIGGDEFLVILPMTDPAGARVYVGRVQEGLARLEAAHPELGRPTLSLGIAEAPRHGTTVSELLAAADSALYRAKRGGRNAVEVAGEGDA